MVNDTKGDFASLVEWEITRKCNLACRHCYSSGPRARRDELSEKEALALAGRMAGLGCRSLTLSGGEPTLRRDWPVLASALNDAGVGVQMVTNGQTLGRREALTARRSGLRLVLLSLDGMRETHDGMRRKRGAFSGVMAAADALASRGVPVGFVTTLVRSNVEDLEPLAVLVSRFGAVVWQVWLGMAQDASDFWLGPHRAPELAAVLDRLKAHCPALVPGDNLTASGGPRPCGCEQGRRVLGIQSDGIARGCLSLPESCNVGSMRRHDLPILWARAHGLRADMANGPGGPGGSACCATALAWAGRRPMAQAVRAGGGGRTLRRAGALAASLILASGIGAGCRAGPGPVTTNGPAEKNVVLDAAKAPDVSDDPTGAVDGAPDPADMPEAQDTVVMEKTESWGLPFNASCICESEKKDEQGAPVDTQPCMCVSHMMCPPSSMWICPSGYTRKIDSGEEGDD